MRFDSGKYGKDRDKFVAITEFYCSICDITDEPFETPEEAIECYNSHEKEEESFTEYTCQNYKCDYDCNHKKEESS